MGYMTINVIPPELAIWVTPLSKMRETVNPNNSRPQSDGASVRSLGLIQDGEGRGRRDTGTCSLRGQGHLLEEGSAFSQFVSFVGGQMEFIAEYMYVQCICGKYF